MTQTVHHRTAPYSRAQMRWAHAAEARGQIAPEHVRVWEQRAKRRDLPEYAGIGQPVIEYTQAEPGFPHAKATVAKMGELIREFSTSYPIRHLATEITRNIPSKSPTKELYALYQWVRKNIRYRKDPRGMEWLQTPCRTLKEGAGDCDCLATLLGALAESLGHPTRLVTVGPTKLLPKHVAVEAYDGKRWITLDPVIEESGDTGLSEPGKFGMQARGARTTWDTRGNMIGAFGAEPTAIAKPNTKIYDLWEANAFKLGSLGYEIPGERQLWAVQEGAIPGYTAVGYLGDMGFSLKKIGKAIGKVGKGVVKVVKKAGKIGGKVAKVAKIAAPIVTMLPIPGARVVGMSMAAGARNLEQFSKMTKKLPSFSKKKGTPSVSTSRAVLPPQAAASAMSRLVGKKPALVPMAARGAIRPAATRPMAIASTRPVTARVPSAAGGLVDVLPMLASSFQDLMNMYHAAAGLSGIKPMLSFTFSGVDETKVLAQKAIDRVNSFIKKVGQPPQIKLAEVLAFQKADAEDKRKGALSTDGLWGPNAAAAAEWYTGAIAPAVAKPYLKYKVTWTSPLAVKAAPVVKKPISTIPPPVEPVPIPSVPPKIQAGKAVIVPPIVPKDEIIKSKDAGPTFPYVVPEPLEATKKPVVTKPTAKLEPLTPEKKPVIVAIKPATPKAAAVPAQPVKLTPVAKTKPPVVSVEPQPTGPVIVPMRPTPTMTASMVPTIPFAPQEPIIADQMPALQVPVVKPVPKIPATPLAVKSKKPPTITVPVPTKTVKPPGPIPKIEPEPEKKEGIPPWVLLLIFYAMNQKRSYYSRL